MRERAEVGADALPRRVDVAVVGGGAAGAAAALTLARSGARVLLVDRDTPRPIVGEGLPPAATPLLDALGLGPRFAGDGHRTAYATQSAWGASVVAEVDFVRQPYGVGWRLDRPRFDALLRAAVMEAGGYVAGGVRARALRRPPGQPWAITLVTTDGDREVQADMLVDASGRARWVARACSVGVECYDRLVGLVGIFGPRPTEAGAPTLVEATPDGWWYATSLPDGRLVVVYLSDGDLIARTGVRTPEGWLALLKRTTHIRERVARQDATLEWCPRPVCAQSSCLRQAAGDGWCAVGDAAAAHDPLSSLGVTAALTTGLRAAEAIAGGGQVAWQEYSQWVAHGYARYLAEWLGYYATEQRWTTSPFWQRRHAAWRHILRA